MRRFKRLSRYAHINWAYRELKKLEKLSPGEQTKLFDEHLGYLLDHYSPLRVAMISRIWGVSHKIHVSPFRMKNFQRFHETCGSIVTRDDDGESSNGNRFFLFAKNKMEIITRTRINRVDTRVLVRDYLKSNINYVGMSDEEYIELNRKIKEHLAELKFHPTIEDISFTVNAWRLNSVLNRLYDDNEPK